MEIRRFFINANDIVDGIANITNEEVGHITKVLRYKAGYKVILCVNSDIDYSATIIEIGATFVRAKIDGELASVSEVSKRVVLYQALLKNSKLDLVVQKATELGVREVIPFVSHNSSWDKVNIDRLSKVAREASKQCHRSRLVNVCNTRSFDEVIESLQEFELIIVPYENECDNTLQDIAELLKLAKSIAILVGSEGGYTASEVDQIKAIGGHSITLGKRILRAETASIVSVALCMYEAGEMSI